RRIRSGLVETTKRTGRGSRPSTSCSDRPACLSARSSAAHSKAQRRNSCSPTPSCPPPCRWTTVVRRRNCGETASSRGSSVQRSTRSGRPASAEKVPMGCESTGAMGELTDFGLIVLLVAGSFSLALAAHKLTELFPVPAPALFLVLAAVASDVWPGLQRLSTVDVERIAVVALIAILFDGGMHVGWARFRPAAAAITALGVRSGTILEGESGANDPVGIALMIGMLDFATHEGASFWTVVREFAVEMSVGLAIGVAGAALVLPLMRHVSLPNEALYPIRTLAIAGVVYGVASVAHGSGFLAVFVAGLLVGSARVPYKGEIE